jgi:hypothetical protein
MEAEYVSIVHAIKELHWLDQLFKSFIFKTIPYSPPVLFSDSISAIHFTKNEVKNSRSKHIDIKYYFCRDWFNRNYFSIQMVPSQANIADIFTKWLSSARMRYLTGGIFS